MVSIKIAMVTLAIALPAQTQRMQLLELKLENWTSYRLDVHDASKLASEAREVPPPVLSRSFLGYLGIADITAINGKPAKGIWTNRGDILAFSPNPAPGGAIANIQINEPTMCMYSFFTADGTFVGKLTDGGHVGGPGGTHPILGGLGAYLGATGEHGWVRLLREARRASVLEDPSLRQTLGGGELLVRVYIAPKSWPEVEVTSAGPSVFHADGSPVSASNPARPGEVLTMRAKGLGPTRPSLFPVGHAPFRSEPPFEEVNSPVEVTVGGKEATVINKIGWPGTLDTYRVDVRVPSLDGINGPAPLRITAAWIEGPEVVIPVQ